MYIILSDISTSLKILNTIWSYCIYNVIRKSTLITYFVKSLLKKHSIKNDQKLSFCDPIISLLA